MGRIYGIPRKVQAEDGVVAIDAPDGVGILLTVKPRWQLRVGFSKVGPRPIASA